MKALFELSVLLIMVSAAFVPLAFIILSIYLR